MEIQAIRGKGFRQEPGPPFREKAVVSRFLSPLNRKSGKPISSAAAGTVALVTMSFKKRSMWL